MAHQPQDLVYEDLFKAAGEGDSGAFEQLCVYLIPDLLLMASRQCRKLGLPPDTAFDVAQECLLRAINILNQKRLKGLSRGFFFIITKNISMDLAKKKQAISNQAERIERIASVSLTTEDVAEIREAFSMLSVKNQTIIDLMLFQNFGAKEVAEKLGASVGSVYKRYERALAELRQMLE